jgi:hypothetical protein
MFHLIVIPLPGDVKVAITTAVFLHIRFPVCTGTNYVPVLLPVSGRKTARARHIAVTVLIDQQIVEYPQCPGLIAIEKEPLFLLDLFHGVVELFGVHLIPSASRRAFSLKPTITF